MKASFVRLDKWQNEGCANMKALVYHGPGKRSLEDKQKPIVKELTDDFVNINRTTVCGTDLTIMKAYDAFDNAAAKNF